MRLGQLSRKLDLSTSKIVTFIKKEFEVNIENHPNTKIDDSFLEKINNEFKIEQPSTVEKITTTEETIPKEEKESDKENKDEATTTEAIKTEEVEQKVETSEPIKETTETKIPEETEVELIKAPKPELKQIKVLRKIELPEKKKIIKKEVSSESTKNTEKDLATLEKELKESIEKPAPVKPKKSTYKRPSKPMKKKKSVEQILAEKKKKEEQERIAEEKRKKEQAKYEKKKRKEHYNTLVTNIKPKKKKKKKQVEIVTKQEKIQAENEAPKTWIGKLIKWFQTS